MGSQPTPKQPDRVEFPTRIRSAKEMARTILSDGCLAAEYCSLLAKGGDPSIDRDERKYDAEMKALEMTAKGIVG